MTSSCCDENFWDVQPVTPPAKPTDGQKHTEKQTCKHGKKYLITFQYADQDVGRGWTAVGADAAG